MVGVIKLILNSNFGTHDECRSQKLQKTVRYLSEICQKTVSCKNQSEFCQKCVRILSENSQMQNCVRSRLETIWKSVRNVTVFKNVSENCQFVIQKIVGNLSEICLKTVICKFVSEVSQKRFVNQSDMYQFLKMCQKTVNW